MKDCICGHGYNSHVDENKSYRIPCVGLNGQGSDCYCNNYKPIPTYAELEAKLSKAEAERDEARKKAGLLELALTCGVHYAKEGSEHRIENKALKLADSYKQRLEGLQGACFHTLRIQTPAKQQWWIEIAKAYEASKEKP